jgi:hypothetical protein
MVYQEWRSLFGGVLGSQVDFAVYNKAGARVNTAQLDSTNAHNSIPNVCLSCHGISANYIARRGFVDSGVAPGDPIARFLAFDPFSYLYSTAPGFTEADQRDAFRRLNAIVLQTRPAPATVDLINGMYAPDINAPTTVANNNYVPTGWANADASQDGKALYVGAVKPGCRTCHASASNPSIDFLQMSDWATRPYRIRSLVCGKTAGAARGHDMPQAEHISKVFWRRGGRALVLGWSQPYQGEFAAPGAPTYPDPNASCDP